jgi:hypothetical protein
VGDVLRARKCVTFAQLTLSHTRVAGKKAKSIVNSIDFFLHNFEVSDCSLTARVLLMRDARGISSNFNHV